MHNKVLKLKKKFTEQPNKNTDLLKNTIEDLKK